MRFAVLAALVLLPSGAALVAEDAPGDVVLQAGPAEAPTERDDTDFLRIGVGNETQDTFDVWVEKAAWASGGSTASCIDGASTRVEFGFGGVTYAVFMGDAAALAIRNEATQAYHRVESISLVVHGDTRIATVPKALVTGLDGLPARSGTSIDSVRAEAEAVQACEPLVSGMEARYLDQVPDHGFHPEPFAFTLGPGSFGRFTVSTPSPVRASNGGPDVFVYPLTVENSGPSATLIIATESVPEGWNVRAAARVTLDQGETATIPILVTTPSRHTHGGQESFDLVFREDGDADVGRYSLGIRYLEVPQLAGHHPQIHVHAGSVQFTTFGGKEATWGSWFNTLAEVEEDSGLDIYSSDDIEWYILMDPSLMMGLDFDTQRQGSARLEFGHDRGGSYSLTTELLHCSPGASDGRLAGQFGCDRGSWLTLAQGAHPSISFAAGTTQSVDIALEPDAYSDFVPYLTGANIMLHIKAEPTTVDPNVSEGLYLVSRTSHLDLPLNEFRDSAETELAAGPAVGLKASITDMQINPGDSAWIGCSVEVDTARDIATALVGYHADWATAHPARLHVEDAARFAVEVRAPPDAREGDYAEIFVIAEDVRDPAASAVVKIRAVVTLEPIEEHRAGADSALQAKPSPGLGLPWLVLAAAGMHAMVRWYRPGRLR